MMVAKVVQDTVRLASFVDYGFMAAGVLDMVTGDYEEYASAPALLEVRGKRMGKSGWNSDTRRIYYRSDHADNVATIVG